MSDETLRGPWTGDWPDWCKPVTTSTSLRDVPEKQLRAWMKHARNDGGVYRPTGWGRHFTIANMSAELARRREEKNEQ